VDNSGIQFTSEMEITLDGAMGSEEDIIRAMIVSTNKDYDGWDDKRDTGRLNRIIRDHHSSPFEMCEMRFIIEVPIFVVRELQRYRTANMNEMSGRYTELPPKFYIPKEENIRTQVGKPMSYEYEMVKSPLTRALVLSGFTEVIEHTWEEYQLMLLNGVARELARAILPLNIYTKLMWKNDLRNIVHFIVQRTHPSAMLEIRELATKMEEIVAKEFPRFYKLWVENGRQDL